MSCAATAIIIKPRPTLNHHPKFNIFLCKTRFSCPSFCSLKESATVYIKLVIFKKPIASVSMETRHISGNDKCISSRPISAFKHEALVNNGDLSYVQTAGGVHTRLNRLSKWAVAVTFGGFMILRHDALALWAATGCISNFILSIALKRILKQDRPVSEVSSGPGMPSSHAQTLFFTIVFMIMSAKYWDVDKELTMNALSVIKSIGVNGATSILGILLVALGSYFSWLRVLLGYHTTSQVIAGIVVGSNFAVLWFWAWQAIVCKAYNSNPWVQVLLFIGGACYYLGFITFVLWHLIKHCFV